MASTKLFSLVEMTVNGAPGTGSITLGSARSSDRLTFAEAGVGNGDVVSYVVEDAGNIEYGIGTYTSATTTLSRDTVRASKIAGVAGTSKITLTVGAVVWIDASAQDLDVSDFTEGTTPAPSTDFMWMHDTSAGYKKKVSPSNLAAQMKLSAFAATTSAELAGVISDETGSGAAVFATSPTLVTPALGTPSSGTLTNCVVTASGATTSRTLPAYFGDIFNVKDFGATGDGATDDTAAIQAAVTALNSAHAGGIVFVPAGNYIVSSAITVPNAVILMGTGSASYLNASASNINVLNFTGNGGGAEKLVIGGYQNTAATNYTVDTTAATVSLIFRDLGIFGGTYALRMRGTDCIVENCFVSGWGTTGGHLLSSGGANWYIRCKFDPNSTQTVQYGAAIIDDSAENHFVECDFSGTFSVASVAIDDSDNLNTIVAFSHCIFSDQVLVTHAKSAQFVGCEFGSSVTVNNNAPASFIGNYFFGATTVSGTNVVSAANYNASPAIALPSTGVVNWGNGAVTVTGASDGLTQSGSSATGEVLTIKNTDAGATGARLGLFHDSASPAASDLVGEIRVTGRNSIGISTTTHSYNFKWEVTTNGLESTYSEFSVLGAGAVKTMALYGSSAVLRPSSNDELALGTPTVSWSDLYLASGGIIGWNNGDVTITHSANTLAFAGASSGYTFDVPIAVASGGTNASAASGTALDNITGFSSTGLLARTAAGTYAFRTVTGTTNQITLANGNGVSGNPTISLATLPGFSAHKNGSDQTTIADVTFTKVTFGTEVYDNGSFFSSSTWTPPAGIVFIASACLGSGTMTPPKQSALCIYKNGSLYKQYNSYNAGTNVFTNLAALIDSCNGSDTYEIYIFVDVDSGTATVQGGTSNTYFVGQWLSPS